MVTSRVYVLYTGGTIGTVPSEPDNPTSPLQCVTAEELQRYLPDIDRLNVKYTLSQLRKLDSKALVPPIDSSNITGEHWQWMAAEIARVYADYDGFVLLHGTDTMAYTASALSFMLTNLDKPVVLTGSQLPIAHPRTDAVGNFVNAMAIAGHRASGLPLVPEVCLCFADTLLRGNRSRKISTTTWRGFDTPNFPHLGTLGENIHIEVEHVRSPADPLLSPFYARTDLDTHVADVCLFPGIRPSQLAAVLNAEPVVGAILRTYGTGNAPTCPALLRVLKDAIQQGQIIVNVTQCQQGMVEAGLYEGSNALLEIGVISGHDMTPEAALTKLMTLAANEPSSEIAAQMQRDHRGEQSVSLFDLPFQADTGNGATGMARLVTTARVPGGIHPAKLKQAILRISGLCASRLGHTSTSKINAFLNYRNAGRDTSPADPRFATHFDLGGDPRNATVDITPVARRVLEAGRSVGLTLVTEDESPFTLEAASLALYVD